MVSIARAASFAAVLFCLLSLAYADAEKGEDVRYVVLTGFGSGSPYHAAARKLAKHHGTKEIVQFDPDAPDRVLKKLRRVEPTHVAIVLRPEQIHVNSVRRILRMATQVDDDPFVDFSFGYVTGATAKEASRMVSNIIEASGQEHPRRVGESAVWGGQGNSTATDGTYRVGSLSFPSRALRFRSPEEGHGRNQEFLDEELKSLEGCGAIIMGGHGMPWEIVSGPRAEDIDKLDLFPAVAFNYACYTGVTGTYPERSYQGRAVTQHLKEVEAKRSFALTVLRRGAVGYVGYVNPRPAGPEMTTEFERVLTGASMGDARRRDYAKITLGYLGYGEPGIVPPSVEQGASIPRAEIDAVRHLMLDASTGGILFGDPLYRPYPVQEEVLPFTSESSTHGEELHVTLRLHGPQAYVWGADPFRRFDEESRTMAMKLYDRVLVPGGIGDLRSVRVEEATWGGKAIETMPVVWAEERDRGKRYLHVKANFARGGRGDIEIRLVASSDELPPAPQRPESTSTSTVVARINQALLQGGALDGTDRKKLAALGREGFDAVLELLRQGRGHYRTHELIAAVRVEGGEKSLIALAEGPDLPNYGTWTVLKALGAFDTPEVRAWLLERLKTERGAGKYMSVADALALLGESEGTKPVADQLLRFEDGWSGVEWQLVHALARMGGADAVLHLVRFVADERATREVAVSYALDHLARLAPEAAKKSARALMETERYAGFSERAKSHFADISK